MFEYLGRACLTYLTSPCAAQVNITARTIVTCNMILSRQHNTDVAHYDITYHVKWLVIVICTVMGSLTALTVGTRLWFRTFIMRKADASDIFVLLGVVY